MIKHIKKILIYFINLFLASNTNNIKKDYVAIKKNTLFLAFGVITQYDFSEEIRVLSQQKLQTRERWRNNADAIYIICSLTCGL